MSEPKEKPDPIPKRQTRKKTANLEGIHLPASPHPAIEMFGLAEPENRKTGIPENPNPSFPENPISTIPENRNPRNPESLIPGTTEIPNSGIPENRNPGLEEILKPGFLENLETGIPEPEILPSPLAVEPPAPENRKTGIREKQKPQARKEKLSLNIDARRIKALKRYALEKDEFLGDCLEQAIDLLVSRKSRKPAAHDKEMMIDDPDDGVIPSSILNLYERLTGRRFSKDDRFAYHEVADYGESLILIGMYASYDNKLAGTKRDEPINSFRYFHGEIYKAAAAGWDADMLRMRIRAIEEKDLLGKNPPPWLR